MSRPYGLLPSHLVLICVFPWSIASSLHTRAVCGADRHEPGLVLPPPTFVRLCGPVIPLVSHLQPRTGFRVAHFPAGAVNSFVCSRSTRKLPPFLAVSWVQCRYSRVPVTFRSLSCEPVHSLVSSFRCLVPACLPFKAVLCLDT